LFVGRNAGGLRVAHGMAAMVCGLRYDEDNQLVPQTASLRARCPGRALSAPGIHAYVILGARLASFCVGVFHWCAMACADSLANEWISPD
jgi:hypothetical protein